MQVYQQIESFYNTKETKNDSKVIGDKYFYVNHQKAKDSAAFIKYLIDNKKINLESSANVMDLCFGSGNLTSHIVLDGLPNTDKIYLNDIDTSITNQDIKIKDKSEVLKLDFLDFKQFKKYEQSIDVLIFNPTISDSDIYNKISIKDNDRVVEKNKHLDIKLAFKKYCKELSLIIIDDIEINKENKTIKVQIEGAKLLLDEFPNSFNGYSLICKTKNMHDYEDKTSIVTKINQTLSTLLKDTGIIIFIGTDKQQEIIFQTYNKVFRYLRNDNDVFVITKSKIKTIECYEKNQDDFIKNDDCKFAKSTEEIESFDSIEIDAYDNEKTKERKEESAIMKTKETKEQFTNETLGKLTFPHKNLLLKGVPGTGKSKTIDNIIENDLDMSAIRDNVLRINIHSASSNSDLMQGISISTDDKSNILYQEKRGAVLKHIFKAIFKPNQPFVLVLEEIQENSLNELIGDLIYLIEKDKRIEVKLEDDQALSYAELFEKINPRHFVELPNLVEGSESNIKMIMPNNLYVFCTSNYRDDKKVIEDNLLRRFDVVEIYPQTQEVLGESVFKSKGVSDFLDKLNEEILKKFEDETHPDRYLVGHANWLNITDEDTEENKKLFYTALLKVLIEFKEIREVDFEGYVKEIVENVYGDDTLPNRLKAYIDACDFEYDTYKEMVEKLQKEIYSFLK